MQVRVLVEHNDLLESTQQFYINVEDAEYKLDTLFLLYESLAITQSVIYVNTRFKARTPDLDR